MRVHPTSRRSWSAACTCRLRRRLLGGLAAIAFATPGLLHAQTWPSKPVRIVLGFSPGATTDALARLIGKQLSENTGQPFIVENRLGAGGTIAGQEVSRSSADGYTLLFTTSSTHSIAPAVSAKLPYSTTKDFTPIVHVADSPMVILASPTIGVKTVGELIALARAKPDLLNYSSSGIGTLGHLASETFKAQAGVSMTHVPYKGSAQAIPDLMAGSVHITWDAIGSGIVPAKHGRVRALGVSGPRRSPLAPEVPTIAESGLPDFSIVLWFGLLGPAGMPPELVQRIHGEVRKALQSPAVMARSTDLGLQPVQDSPAEFAAAIAKETADWSRLVRQLKLKVD